jgi:hypothetical protein
MADYRTLEGSDSPWLLRIQSANKMFGEWEGKFKCKLLEEYYEGFQWKQRRDYPTTNYNPYTLNLVYSTIKIKLASILFQKPQYIIGPSPGNSQWNMDFAVQSAQLKEDVLNTIVQNPNINFVKHIKRAALDSFFRFGIIEVGYASDWRNPNKTIPELKSWDDKDIPESEDKIVEENPVPVNERFYVKRIWPHRFRVCATEATDLDECDWVGYYDYYYTRVLQNTKGIDWPEIYSGGSYVSAEYASGFVGGGSGYASNDDTLKALYSTGEISRVWHIWDMVKKERLLLLEGAEMYPLWNAPFERMPFIDLRWDFRIKGFYPLPPVFQWLSPQDEINEAREQVRSYRRRFTRKFQTVKGMIDEEEKEKFSSGPDGILVEVKQPDAIKAIDNPEIGPTSENALVLAKDDFNIISGTSAEARGQDTDRETATQAKIVQNRAQIRESADQLDFSNWLCSVGRELLCQCQERLVDGLWVKYTENPDPNGEPGSIQQIMQNAGPVYKYVSSQEIDDGYDYTVDFDVQNATPAAMQAAQTSFVNFLAIVNQFPQVAMNPALIREAAYRVGYKNEAVIKQMQQTAMAQLKMQAIQQAAQIQQGGEGKGTQGPGAPGNTAKARNAQMAVPGTSDVNEQLSNQIQ